MWAGELLSLTVWLQVATLSGYTKKRLVRAAHSAVVRGLSTSPHDSEKTVQYLYKVYTTSPCFGNVLHGVAGSGLTHGSTHAPNRYLIKQYGLLNPTGCTFMSLQASITVTRTMLPTLKACRT